MITMAGHKYVILVTLLAVSVFAAKSRANEIIYVNAAATGANDGTSWTNAYLDLQDALDEAAVRCIDTPCEIWVTAGTYKPDRLTGDPLASFQLVSNVGIYGGFAGWETERDQRDYILNETILEGDLLGNDLPNGSPPTSDCCTGHETAGCDNSTCEALVCADYSHCCQFEWVDSCAGVALRYCCDLCKADRCDNTRRIVYADGVDATAILDGFTIRRGHGYYAADESGTIGTGLSIVDGSPTIENCTFIENAASVGGAVGCTGATASPSFRNCAFIDNEAVQSAGLDFYLAGSTSIESCRFINNRATIAAAINSYHSEGLVVRNSIFDSNATSQPNSEIIRVLSSDPVFENCLFTNHDDMVIDIEGSPTFKGCEFTGNNARCVQVFFGSPTLDSCWFHHNTPGTGSAALSVQAGLARLSDCRFEHNSYGVHTALSVSLGAVIADRCVFSNNLGRSGGATTIFTEASEGIFRDCEIDFNRSECSTESCIALGNGTLKFFDSEVLLQRCAFRSNQVQSSAGAILIQGPDSHVRAENCLFFNNSASGAGGGGGAIFNSNNSVAELNHCTFVSNKAFSRGGAIYNSETVEITDSIFWNNIDQFGVGETSQIFTANNDETLINHSLVQGWTGALGGDGNIGDDPLFSDPDGPDDFPGNEDDDFRLSADSPCIDAGALSFLPNNDDADLDGHARILCGYVDMGAYEFGIGDYSCDRVVELADFAQFPACFTGPAPQETYQTDCAAYDFATEINEDVDLLDFAGLQRRGFDQP